MHVNAIQNRPGDSFLIAGNHMRHACTISGFIAKKTARTGVYIVVIIEAMRVVIYTRVSTEEQAGKDKGSHDDQIEKAKRTISEHGWDLLNIYQDTQKG